MDLQISKKVLHNLSKGEERDIKALLKLGKMYAAGNNKECSVDIIKKISGFVPNINKK